MRKILIAGLCMASMAVVSCTGNGGATSADAATADVNVCGRWNIESIVLGDSVVRPAAEVPGAGQYFVFTDSSYSITTNCNSFYGSLAVEGDSISLGAGAMTEMACDNMATEDALRQILPQIATVGVENDSTIRLNTADSSAYVVLTKTAAE